MLIVMMGTECLTATLSEDPEPSIPPGFGPFAALALQGVQNDVKPADTHSSPIQVLPSIKKDIETLECQSSSAQCLNDTPCSTSGSYTCRKLLRNRPAIDYSRFDHISDEDSEVEVAEKCIGSMRCRQQLPKGVHRGCAECSDCQKLLQDGIQLVHAGLFLMRLLFTIRLRRNLNPLQNTLRVYGQWQNHMGFAVLFYHLRGSLHIIGAWCGL